jgi:hypothetical protein
LNKKKGGSGGWIGWGKFRGNFFSSCVAGLVDFVFAYFPSFDTRVLAV